MSIVIAAGCKAFHLYRKETDMRKGFDALSGIVQQHMNSNVLKGGVYIFINRKRNQIKLLTWEGDGLAIWYKRLEAGRYRFPSSLEDQPRVEVRGADLLLVESSLESPRDDDPKRGHLTAEEAIALARGAEARRYCPSRRRS